jgi:hypothetical protein
MRKMLQLSLIQLDLVRPVTPKVAGSSPVAPAICGCRVTASSAAEVFAFDGSDGRQFLFDVLTALAFRVHCTFVLELCSRLKHPVLRRQERQVQRARWAGHLSRTSMIQAP